MKSKALAAWMARLNYIRDEYPFGPLQTFLNEEGKLHRADGPAYISPNRVIYYIDGRKHGLDVTRYGSMCYYFENISVPAKYFLEPEKLTVDEVLTHPNTEVRYAGIKIVGYDKILNSSNVKVIHRDKKKNQILFHIENIFNDPIAIVQVEDGTPNPDTGVRKKYYLTVPPTMTTCDEAVAWTFYKEKDEYHPSIET